MKVRKLRIGDRIRIIAVPGEGIPNYFISRGTIRVYKKLMARNRSVRIREIDEYGLPWFTYKFKRPDGSYEWHLLAVMDNDNNWIRVLQKKRYLKG